MLASALHVGVLDEKRHFQPALGPLLCNRTGVQRRQLADLCGLLARAPPVLHGFGDRACRWHWQLALGEDGKRGDLLRLLHARAPSLRHEHWSLHERQVCVPGCRGRGRRRWQEPTAGAGPGAGVSSAQGIGGFQAQESHQHLRSRGGIWCAPDPGREIWCRLHRVLPCRFWADEGGMLEENGARLSGGSGVPSHTPASCGSRGCTGSKHHHGSQFRREARGLRVCTAFEAW
mmetsp:Transcript_102164/g.256070  ORF Transcript_102164/g.256070 Transcript_102164/m.256070 type:complete len:232 (-) Transcript_102164:640-1335(-)